MDTINITTSQNIDLEYELASVGERITGYIIDWLVIIAYCIIIFATIGFGSAGGFFNGYAWIVIIVFIPPFFYHLLSEILLNGQSIGKKVMGIKVISLTGAQPSIGQYLIRWLFRILDFSVAGGLIALLLVIVTQKKQRLGDVVAGTTLVKTRPRTEFTDTLYEDTNDGDYHVTYPEVINLKDSDIELLREVLLNVNRTGNTLLALQAQHKVEQRLHIMSRSPESETFLKVIIADYNHVTSRL